MHPQLSSRCLHVCASLLVVCATNGSYAQDITDHNLIAITEFMNNPNAVESTEWVEVFNYGLTTMNFVGWSIADETGGLTFLPALNIGPGEFRIFTKNRVQFEAEWFGGIPNSSVIEVNSTFVLNNTSDQLILRNELFETVWNLAYINDETSGRATFLTIDDFTITDYGNLAAPGVSRTGDDLGIAGFLGYQENTVTPDPFAFLNVSGDIGSPLAGNYSVILPCPADTNGDTQVNVDDLITLLAAWGPNPGHIADFNNDGSVNVDDLVTLLAAWGACP